jgi:hypothetical protein
MPQAWNYGTDRLDGASVALGSGGRGFERYGLLTTLVGRPRLMQEKKPPRPGRLVCNLAFNKGHEESKFLCSQLLYCTVCVNDAELLAIFESPRYVTVTTVEPTGRVEIASVALCAHGTI